jgi:DNA-binding NarL/FixJ family response regulator
MTNNEIATKLFLSSTTVDTHRKNLLAKLDVKNTAALVRVAIRQNLID